MPIKDDIEALDNDDTNEKEVKPKIPRARIPKPKGKAAVRTTVSYTADLDDKDDDNEDNEQDTNVVNHQMPAFGFPRYGDNRRYKDAQAPPKNRLAEMFGELRDYADNVGDIFYALITRRSDLMNDHFRAPCNMAQTFPPLQVTPDAIMSFVPTLQRYNNNSGGRFDIVITDEYGESIDIGISNLMIPNPVTEPKQPTDASGESSQVLEMVERMIAQSEDRFERLLQTISARPEKDRLAVLMEQKIEREIMNPQPAQGSFNADEFLARIFTTEAMLTTLSEKFSARLGDGNQKETSTLEKILGNELIVNKAGELIGQVASIAEHIATQKTQPQPPVIPNSTPYAQPVAPVKSAEDMKNEQLIVDIISELESERPLDDTNPMIARLKSEFAPTYDQLKMLCAVTSFEQLFTMLKTQAPGLFAQFYDGNELNERGEILEDRLNEFYVYLGGMQPLEYEDDVTTDKAPTPSTDGKSAPNEAATA